MIDMSVANMKRIAMESSEYFIVIFIALLSYFLVKNIIVRVVTTLFKKTKNKIDDYLIDSKIFNQLALIAPAVVLIYSSDILRFPKEITQIITAYILVNITLCIIRLFTLINTIYSTFEIANRRPIKGYIQLFQVIIGFLGVISAIYISLGKSPIGILSGLGAMTAILILVFKDTILSFIAGMQIMFNDLIHKGDWIEVPKFGADGDVIDIALYNVTVQNFDKTIVYIPTSKLLEGSFKNWRGMQESGGRRIKRSIHIDQSSIRFADKEMIDKFNNIELLKSYIGSKLKEDIDPDGRDINRRKLTNIGTFRAYVINYLKNHPKLNKDMTMIVRQLSPTPDGLPIEIYVFADTTNWADYEEIQSDIFDHLIAAVNEFDLKVFQHPAGTDIKQLLSSNEK